MLPMTAIRTIIRCYVLENANKDPFEGEFVMKGRISTDKDNNWAIDGSVFEHKGELYMVLVGLAKRAGRYGNTMYLHCPDGESLDIGVGTCAHL